MRLLKIPQSSRAIKTRNTAEPAIEIDVRHKGKLGRRH
jgi:hypothetical protein